MNTIQLYNNKSTKQFY